MSYIAGLIATCHLSCRSFALTGLVSTRLGSWKSLVHASVVPFDSIDRHWVQATKGGCSNDDLSLDFDRTQLQCMSKVTDSMHANA